MIVKDEIKTLPVLLESVKDYVTDYVVVDTGSTDGTPILLEERGITVHYMNFEDFGTSRNHALQLAVEAARDRPAYIMLVDADFELVVEDKEQFISLLNKFEHDVIKMVQQSAATRYTNVRLVKAQAKDVHWVGAVHEYLYIDTSTEMELPMEVSELHDEMALEQGHSMKR
jgi:glycosyltransferase involved in cell wall biosynthesis